VGFGRAIPRVMMLRLRAHGLFTRSHTDVARAPSRCVEPIRTFLIDANLDANGVCVIWIEVCAAKRVAAV
jgi:hypothetical protein